MVIRLETLRLEKEVKMVLEELQIDNEEQQRLMGHVGGLLRNAKNIHKYEHSLRCGILGKDVALSTIDLHPNILVYGGILHDVGLVMGEKNHEMTGYYINRGEFDFSSLITANHRGFSSCVHDNRGLSRETIKCNNYYSLVVRAIDHFDELTHPMPEGASEPIIISGEQIKEELISKNETQKYFINNLYKKGIFK